MEAHNKIISYAMDITEENEFINETDLDSTVEIQEIQKLPTIIEVNQNAYRNEDETLTFEIGVEGNSITPISEVILYVKPYGHERYSPFPLKKVKNNQYSKIFQRTDFINKQSLEYYYYVSNGFLNKTTEVYTIENAMSEKNTFINVEQDERLFGVKQLITEGNHIIVDDLDVTKDAYKTIGELGVLTFDTTKTNPFFKNLVSVGNTIIGTFDEGTYSQWRTYMYEVDACHYDDELHQIVYEFHAGNKANDLQHNIENNDNFLIKNIHMILPNGERITPVKYETKKGLGNTEHKNLNAIKTESLLVSEGQEIEMGDSTDCNEILYVTFALEEEFFNELRYNLDTKDFEDGHHQITVDGIIKDVYFDNTPPVIMCNIEEGEILEDKEVHIQAIDEFNSSVCETQVRIDGVRIAEPYYIEGNAIGLGAHQIWIQTQDICGNVSEKIIEFQVKYENPMQEIDINTESIGNVNKVSHLEEIFPYDEFYIYVNQEEITNQNISVIWAGESSSNKNEMYVYDNKVENWIPLRTKVYEEENQLILQADIEYNKYVTDLKNIIGLESIQNSDTQLEQELEQELEQGSEQELETDRYGIRIKVQNGEGYVPEYYVNETSNSFTMVVQSDTQYYNEDFAGNIKQAKEGKYQYQLDMNRWIAENRVKHNIQYMFHDGDIVDDSDIEKEWEQADKAYKMLDEAGIPYGVLAGNHDVNHMAENYGDYGRYFGEERYENNPWYGESYENNRGHYDLITVGHMDFIMLYMGWGIGTDEIEWMNDVLKQYPERKAILNLHEYLLASGGLGEEAKRVQEEVVRINENVMFVFSGHYHNALLKIETYRNKDGSLRNVHTMLFNYQGLEGGGMGYLRLLEFDLEKERMNVKTFSPIMQDYNAKPSFNTSPEYRYYVPGANESIIGSEEFVLTFQQMGLEIKPKELKTNNIIIYDKNKEEES